MQTWRGFNSRRRFCARAPFTTDAPRSSRYSRPVFRPLSGWLIAEAPGLMQFAETLCKSDFDSGASGQIGRGDGARVMRGYHGPHRCLKSATLTPLMRPNIIVL